jgi:hypothetical protein
MNMSKRFKVTLRIWAIAGSLFLAAILCGQELDYLAKDSFYRTYKKPAATAKAFYTLPVTPDEVVYQEFFYKDRIKLLLPLAERMNTYLDSLEITHTLAADSLLLKGQPRVFVGSSEAETALPGSDMMRQEHDKYAPMIIALKKPAKEWKTALNEQLDTVRGAYVLCIKLAFAEYPKSDMGLFMKKVRLGTNYDRVIRFLSAEDEAVEVLQVTGILLDKKGDVLRAGAEGIIYKDSPFWAQVFDVKKGVDDKAIEKLISAQKRDDLPGKPLAWKAALDMLLKQLSAQKNT